MRSRSPRFRIVAALLALVAACAGGVALAASASIPDDGGVFHACRKVTNGKLRLVANESECRNDEVGLSWDQHGEKGEPGPVGPAGPEGPQGPKGDPGAGISAIDQLTGIACTADGNSGTIVIDWDAGNEAVLVCDTSGGGGGGGGGGGSAILNVNEFSTGVTGAAADEFVEIANVGDAAANVGGYKVAYRSAAGTSDTTLVTIADGTTIPAGGFYLLGGSGYGGAHAADESFSTGLAATGGGVGLRDASGALLDSAAWGDTTTNAFVEAHPATAPPATAAPGSSAQRLPDGHDTNDNAADFSVTANPSPGEPNH